MNCTKCGKELAQDEEVVEITSGYVSDDAVIADDSLAMFCTKCEELVMPMVWAEVNR